MVQGLVSTPVDETKVRVRLPVACAGSAVASAATRRGAIGVATRTTENLRPVLAGIERGVAIQTMAVTSFMLRNGMGAPTANLHIMPGLSGQDGSNCFSSAVPTCGPCTAS